MSTPDANARFIAENRREACLIAPLPINDDLEGQLIAAFGGYTRTGGRGAWFDGISNVQEDVAIYTIAMLDTAFTRETLINFAKQYRLAANQTCVYVRLPDGSVTFIGE